MGVAARGYDFVAEVAPREGDVLLPKKHPSAFFGTPLASYLVGLGADTLVVTGCTTSGCVRGTVVDGFAYNFRVPGAARLRLRPQRGVARGQPVRHEREIRRRHDHRRGDRAARRAVAHRAASAPDRAIEERACAYDLLIRGGRAVLPGTDGVPRRHRDPRRQDRGHRWRRAAASTPREDARRPRSRDLSRRDRRASSSRPRQGHRAPARAGGCRRARPRPPRRAASPPSCPT